jgi:hypothetical protein
MERLMRTNPTTSEIFVLELALTFEETNIGLEDGDAWIDKAMPTGAKKARIAEMPHDLLVELSSALGSHVPNWGIVKKEEQDK